MKDLPKVFVNNIEKEIINSQERTIIEEEKTIDLEQILSNNKYSFNHKYKITLKNGNIIDDSIIQLMNNKILTIDNGWIDLNNIRYIVEIKK